MHRQACELDILKNLNDLGIYLEIMAQYISSLEGIIAHGPVVVALVSLMVNLVALHTGFLNTTVP